ncbi:MAG: hypothetical protein FJ041_04720 [Candidatus Cloacimonetes bacterium]|nr:hypothetical protein [Candidatus Cloacimonadota bacterium]
MKEKPDLKTLRELYNNVPEFNKLNISPLIINTLNDLRQIIFGEQDTEISPLNISTLATKSSNTAIPHSRKNEKDQPINSNINNSFKHTFSQDQVIDLFYNGIEQTKITKQKRERAEVNIKKLLKEGFTLEDIQFAIKWTLENAKEEPYDFSIINHTIGQAMAEKGKAEKKEAENLEKERILAQKQEEEEKQEKLLEKVKEYKNSLDGEQRKQLREGALKAIRSTKGIREEFITEILIEAKENELIYKQAIEE